MLRVVPIRTLAYVMFKMLFVRMLQRLVLKKILRTLMLKMVIQILKVLHMKVQKPETEI